MLSYSNNNCFTVDITIIDVPPEILQTYVFRYLNLIDVHNLSHIGSKRLKEISEDYAKRRKSNNMWYNGKHYDGIY